MRFGVLGPLAVWTDGPAGVEVRVPEVKVRLLLAMLLADAGRPVSTDRLVDALWGERPPRNATGTLQARVSQLRKVLDGAEPGARRLIAARPPGYLLDVPPDAVDAGRFAALLVRAGEAADPSARARLLGDALALWRGPAFEGLDGQGGLGVPHAATALEERRLVALEEHAEARLELGEHAALAADLAAEVARHPLRERLRAAHLRALHRAGRRNEALAGYHDLRERLAEEMGVDPGPALASLYRSMLEQDPSEEDPSGEERPRVPSRLPVALGELIGREDAVRRTRDLLAADPLTSTRLVTLTGPGGVGKTRLALEAAARSAGDHPGGVWFVELAAVRAETAEDVAEQAARVLGLREDGAGGPVERLAGALRGRRALLVLDNCEHLAGPAADLAARLLSDAPGLRVLTTSREPLGVPGEQLQIVPPLALPAGGDSVAELLGFGAVRLFVARAEAAAPGFALDAASAPWVVSICRRLDGLPLALELAATRVRALGVRDLAAGLDDRFRLLSDVRRGGPARQRTLRAVIDWSWEPLTEPERAALRRLAVHAGGCTLAAAEAVGGGCADVLARLVDRSLVVRGDDGRYRLLESVAAYGLERLRESGEEEEFRRRHADHYTAFAEHAALELRGHGQPEWLDRLDDEAANLRLALDHADGGTALRLVNAQAWYWFLRGRSAEARRALAAALAAAGPAPAARTETAAARTETETWLAGFTMASGEATDSEELRRAALAHHGDEYERAKAEWFLTHVHWAYGDLVANEKRVGSALAVFRSRADRWHTAAALAIHAKQAMGRGDLRAMERAGAESLAIFTGLGDRWGRLEATDVLSRHAEITGDHAEAARLRRAELRLARELRMWPDVAFRLAALGRIALLTGDLAEAHHLHERSLELAKRHAAPSAAEFAEIGLGLVARRRGDLDAAQAHLRAPLDWLRGIGGTAGIAFAHAQLGFVAEERGDAAAARDLHTEGLAAARATGDPRAIALALEGLAGARSLAGEHAPAARLLGAAAALRASAGAPLPAAERGDVDRISGRIRAAVGVSTFGTEFDRGRREPPDAAVPHQHIEGTP
ncbi:BTAD domain-containing putative transcriptional regulator [Actinomadura sp. NEAU-AAG7]|uniref:BTAD domain-containing putative transcriptional regulator n=1 Tax=Actinomadura sp. NEAU-AAG7 TaxID=2839640 RepID=UPI001BE46B7A|nr:BTAD domain-containing putative transcriptional regulator [Actinomadura sp. NEAU-AAG7]MBT2207436.1 winged helix-turn-helix domain-containing protein [Actinomadura sp. NEAU-AAG7]